ncbi:MAG: biopolymer transporter ExbD [Pirellulaceae bacterium]|jgi:biopolymer transport protein ExbD|nr:biopolymer transporter ExbD [Pirellulaceae bacterium]
MATAPDNSQDATIPSRRKNLDDAEMDITPMIDITFLLLIFFLVASRMDTPSPPDLPIAKNGGSTGTRNAIVISLKVNGKGDALIYKGAGEGGELKSKDHGAQEAELVDYIEGEVRKDASRNKVLILGEKKVRQRDMDRVARAIGKVTAVGELHVGVMKVN